MSHQIQGEIKRGNSGDRSKWEAAYDAPPSGGELLPVEGKVLAVNSGALLGGYVACEDGTLHLSTRGLDRLARLLGDGAGEFLLPFGKVLGDAPEHALAFERRQAPRGA